MVAATEFQVPRLAAFHFDGASARKLWEHFPGKAIATESGGLDPEARWPTVRHDSRWTGRAAR